MSFDPDQMDSTNNFIRNRFLGYSADGFLERMRAEENVGLQSNLHRLREELNQRQQEGEGFINERIVAASEINIAEPAGTQTEELGKRVQELTQMQQPLNQTLNKNQGTLNTQKDQLNHLNSHLKQLKSDLKKARHAGFPHQGELYCFGQRATSSISGLPTCTFQDHQDLGRPKT